MGASLSGISNTLFPSTSLPSSPTSSPPLRPRPVSIRSCARKNCPLPVTDSCQPRSFQFLAWLLFIQASPVTYIIPSHRNRQFITLATWSPCGRIHAPFSVCLPCAFTLISRLYVFIEPSLSWPFSRKKPETRRSANPEASRFFDPDHPEPLPSLLPTSDFRTSLILPGCVQALSIFTLQSPPPSHFHLWYPGIG
jgi:hypothetical protein